MMFSVLPLSLFVFKLVKLVHLYRESRRREPATDVRRDAGRPEPLAHDRRRDVERLRATHRPFFRTPKQAQRHEFLRALMASREEAFMMVGLWFAAFAVSRIPYFDGDLPGLVGSPDLTVWVTRTAGPVDSVRGGSGDGGCERVAGARRLDRRMHCARGPKSASCVKCRYRSRRGRATMAPSSPPLSTRLRERNIQHYA